MKISDNAMSAILLYSYLGIKKESDVKPFTLTEWEGFLNHIIELGYEPKIIFEEELNKLSEIGYSQETIERIKKLAARGGAVAYEIDDLQRKGIEVVTLFDKDYPKLCKYKLKRRTTPVLYYAGNINLANRIGIAIAGSRNIDQVGQQFTVELARKAALEKLVIYSGGAKGVDSISEKTAIEHGGAFVSFLADSLSARIKKKEIISYILDNRILLFSESKPDSGFSVAGAMARNRLIYTSAYVSFAVRADYNKGGTWAGVVENLKNDWTRQYVWNNDSYVGNMELIKKGAIPYELSDLKLREYFHDGKEEEQIDIYQAYESKVAGEAKGKYESFSFDDNNLQDIYYLVKDHLIRILDNPKGVKSISKLTNTSMNQMKKWLDRLEQEELVECVKGKYKMK